MRFCTIVAGLYQSLEKAMDKITDSEVAMEARISALERRMAKEVTTLAEKSRDGSANWMVPFIVLLGIIIVAGFVFLRGYRKIMKTHML